MQIKESRSKEAKRRTNQRSWVTEENVWYWFLALIYLWWKKQNH
jgi:hypothetical protein